MEINECDIEYPPCEGDESMEDSLPVRNNLIRQRTARETLVVNSSLFALKCYNFSVSSQALCNNTHVTVPHSSHFLYYF